MGTFAGRKLIAIGGSSGMGRQAAADVVEAGGSAVIVGRNGERVAETVDLLSRNGKAWGITADLANRDEVRRVEDALASEHADATLLVNSAGVNMAGIKLVDMALAHFDRVVRTDLYGPFLTCRRFARPLVAAGMRGRIVNISSIHERAPRAGAAGYDAAKGGLAQLTATLALELAPLGIAVNGVAPGMILTPMNARALADVAFRREREAFIPWGRAGRAEEVAELVTFLLSPAADYITGATVTIDGGLSLVVAPGA